VRKSEMAIVSLSEEVWAIVVRNENGSLSLCSVGPESDDAEIKSAVEHLQSEIDRDGDLERTLYADCEEYAIPTKPGKYKVVGRIAVFYDQWAEPDWEEFFEPCRVEEVSNDGG
jgi:hypothetical protein